MSTVSENMLDLYMTLYADEAKCLSSLDKSLSHIQDMHFCHRGFVRAACAVIEGATYCMKYASFITFNELGLSLSDAEVAMLLEKSYRIDKRGEARERKAHLSVRDSIPFAFNMYARAHGREYLIKKDSQWANFELALGVRDRLMHPKSIADLFVPEKETKIVADASIWFGRHIVALFRCCNVALAEKINDFENQLNEIASLHKSAIEEHLESGAR